MIANVVYIKDGVVSTIHSCLTSQEAEKIFKVLLTEHYPIWPLSVETISAVLEDGYIKWGNNSLCLSWSSVADGEPVDYRKGGEDVRRAWFVYSSSKSPEKASIPDFVAGWNARKPDADVIFKTLSTEKFHQWYENTWADHIQSDDNCKSKDEIIVDIRDLFGLSK